MTAKVYALANNKGGVFKTTNTRELGYGLARRGYKIIILSMDGQCNSDWSLLGYVEEPPMTEEEEAAFLLIQQEFLQFAHEYPLEQEVIEEEIAEETADPPGMGSLTLYDIIIDISKNRRKHTIREAMVQLPQEPNLWIAKGSPSLADLDLEIGPVSGREKFLWRLIQPILEEFDFILIDTPPNLGLCTVMSFYAAGLSEDPRNGGIIFCVSPQVYAVQGVRQIILAILMLRENMDIPLMIFGVIVANVRRTKNVRSRINQMRSFFQQAIFPTMIPQSEKVEEAADSQVPLSLYAPKNPGAIQYDLLVSDFLRRAQMPLQKETTHAKSH